MIPSSGTAQRLRKLIIAPLDPYVHLTYAETFVRLFSVESRLLLSLSAGCCVRPWHSALLLCNTLAVLLPTRSKSYCVQVSISGMGIRISGGLVTVMGAVAVRKIWIAHAKGLGRHKLVILVTCKRSFRPGRLSAQQPTILTARVE